MLEEYIVLDLEMTGLKVTRDKILEIGAVRIRNRKIEAEYQTLVNPHRKLADKIKLLTGITDEMAAAGMEEKEAVNGLVDFCRGLPVAGHNIALDYRFLKQSAVNHGIFFEAEALDTLKLVRKLFPELEKKTLDYLCGYFSIVRKQNHRALEDAKATAELLELLRQKCGKKADLFCPGPLHFKVKKQGPITPRQKKYLKELTDYHKIDLPVPIEKLTKNEASRLTNQIVMNKNPVL